MTPFGKIQNLIHIARWITNWNKKDLDFIPKKVKSPKFISARAAAAQIPNNAVVSSSGMAGTNRCSIFFWAIKDRYLSTQQPNNLTWITNTGQGGRGKIPGTIEELGIKGLIKTSITAHHETHKSFLRLAEQGDMELHVIPQGQMAFLAEAQANNKSSVKTKTGVGTFLDPRIGTGTAVTKNSTLTLVTAHESELEYTIPKIKYYFFIVPYADEDGNLYIKDAAFFNEIPETIKAVHANGGKVFATVSKIVPKNHAPIFIHAAEVDGIVVSKYNEQTASIPQLSCFKMFTENAKVDINASAEKLRHLNNILGVTPKRYNIDVILARLTATLFSELVHKHSYINIGIGLPEEAARIIAKMYHPDDFTFLTEAGAIGGLPASGLFFGASISPKKIVSSAEIFKLMYDKLEVAILGMIEADSNGNVNVSRRGAKATQVVGTGGFTDISTAAKTLIFVGSFMVKGEFLITGNKLKIKTFGQAKLVDKVREVTFNAQEALKQNKKIYYVTNVGIFQYTERGMELIKVMPGIDIKADIIDKVPMKIVLPKNGIVPIADTSIISGKNFHLAPLQSSK